MRGQKKKEQGNTGQKKKEQGNTGQKKAKEGGTGQLRAKLDNGIRLSVAKSDSSVVGRLASIRRIRITNYEYDVRGRRGQLKAREGRRRLERA